MYLPSSNTDMAANGGAQNLKNFQLTATQSEKLKKDYGKKMAEYVLSTLGGTGSGYYWLRNNRFLRNRNWAHGRIDVQAMFADRLELNGKQNYINVSWHAIMIVNRIMSGLVGRWMDRTEKVHVTAIDPLSVKAKQENYEEAEMVLFNKAQLAELEKKSGVPMTSPDQFIPEDKDELETWKIEGHKLPEEIKYETETNNILDSVGWFDVLKEKCLHDSGECGLIGAYTYMDEYGVIHPEYIKSEQLISSYSEYPDFRDSAFRGFIKPMKISELRRKYSKEFGGELDEEQLWKIAQTSKDYRRYDTLLWMDSWATAYIRPYDEWNIDVLWFWLKSVDKDGMTVTVTKQNKSTLLHKSGRPVKLDENQEYVEDEYWNLYKGIYARDAGVMLEWGLETNMIRPQDPKESGNVEFPLSIFMYQNNDMRNIALPEKIEEPVSEMIIVRLKIQALIAKMVPAGAAINTDALQELDLGLASGPVSPSKAETIWRQTGTLYYRGRDAEGNPIPVPIQEISNSGFVNQMQALISLYQFHYQVLKDELGEDPNLITAATQPRVTSDNVEVSQRQADAATDYMYKAYLYLMEDMAKKIACLLNSSVKYGANVYRQITQEEVQGRNFSTKIKLLPDQYELQRFDGYINQMLANNPELSLFIDPIMLSRIAKENLKLANLYFRNGQKRMLRHQADQAQRQSEDNAKMQAGVAQQTAEAEFKLEQAKAHLDILKADATSKANNETTLLQIIGDLLKAGIPLPSEFIPVKNQLLTNLSLSLGQENKHMIKEATMEEMAEQQEAQEQQQAEQQEQEGQGEMQEQPEMQMQ